VGTLHHMHIIDIPGETIRYPHHKQILFTLPNVKCTTVAKKRNWNCDRVISRAAMLPREEQLVTDEDGDYDDDDEEDDIDEG